MTSKQIEALVQIAENELKEELGIRPSIFVEDRGGCYDVELHYHNDTVDITEKIGWELDECDLTQFLEQDLIPLAREFYGRVKQDKKERNPEWKQSVFMYEHTFTELFDALMSKVGSMLSDLEDNEDTDINEDKQYALLGKLFLLYEACMSTSMSDI